mmetsp:Transcript_14635/g.22693  ORF Transcript_14635/g.22693 Transcript_14635/m.22693 type:complete len:127 (+) Transcript_14635:1271-1651(+)
MVPELSSSKIRIGDIVVKGSDVTQNYLYILDQFTIQLYNLNDDLENPIVMDAGVSKNYTFMLILPKSVIQNKIDKVNTEVGNDITSYFIAPFIIFSVCMMIIIIYFLVKISTQITKPIIELQDKIK